MRAYRVVDRLYPTPCVGLNTLRISDAKMPREDGRIRDAIWPHEMDASEMRKAGNPTCMHVGDDETTRHNSASEMRDTRRKRPHRRGFVPPPSCASPMRAYRVVDRLYPTPCVGLNTLRISDAICPRETDASEMRYTHTRWTHRRGVRWETPRACT